MPLISPEYLRYLEQQFAAQSGQSSEIGGVGIPPANMGVEPTTAPGPNPRSYGYNEPPGTANPYPTTISQTPTTPTGFPTGLESPGIDLPLPPAPGTPPYNNPTAGTNAVNPTLFPPGETPSAPSGELPAPPTTGSLTPGAPNDQFALPGNGGNGILDTLGNLFRGIAGMFPGGPGGWGQPMGYFPSGTAGPGPLPTLPGSAGTSLYNPHGSIPLPGALFNLGAGGGGSIEGIGGKLMWHAAQPQFGGRTLAQVARQNPELLPGLSNMGAGFQPSGGSPSQKVGTGSSGRILSSV